MNENSDQSIQRYFFGRRMSVVHVCAAGMCEIAAELDCRAHPMQRGGKGRQSSPGEITKRFKCDKCVAVFF